MKARSLACALALSATPAHAWDASDVVGTWRLVTATRKIVDTGETVDAYGGPKPNGWLNYDKDGRMMVICAYDGRNRPIANDKMTDEDRIKLHKSFFAYAGTYTIEGETITHTIDTSWNEAWTGTAQVRNIEYKNSVITLTMTPFKFNLDGKTSIITLIWEKYPKS